MQLHNIYFKIQIYIFKNKLHFKNTLKSQALKLNKEISSRKGIVGYGRGDDDLAKQIICSLAKWEVSDESFRGKKAQNIIMKLVIH